jgi:cation:H+ antiporter
METVFLDIRHWKLLLYGFVSALKQGAVRLGSLDPWFSLFLFLLASAVMIWRLGAMEKKGFEGTALGTLIMPYASGFSNLAFAFILGKSGGAGSLVLENCLVNNTTNLTLIIGLSTLFWTLVVIPTPSKRIRKRVFRTARINHLSLLLTLIALFFFTGTLWALARDGVIDFSDGLVLVGLFFFWQLFQVFDVLKDNVLRKHTLPKSIVFDFSTVIASGFGIYYSIDRLVAWVPRGGSGFLVFENLGWLTGLLMVFPNALVAFYYAWARRADIVFSSQIGDGHICIPMCVGIFALFKTIEIPPLFNLGIGILLAAGLLLFLFLVFLGRLPKWAGLLLTGAYGLFVYQKLIP